MTVVSENKKALTGFGTITTKEGSEIFSTGKYAKLNEIFVKEDFRRKGIASDLLNRLFEHAKKVNCEHVELNVNVENESGKRLYENEGFESEKIKMVREL